MITSNLFLYTTWIAIIHRIGISIQILIEGERDVLAARMLIHRDEPSGLGIIVSGAKMIQASCWIEALACVPMPGAAGRIQLNAKGIEIQGFNALARLVRDESGAALGIGVEMLNRPLL